MSERKVFFPGLGGNRYEVSLEELRTMAYKGKVKREDELILWEKKDDGSASEIRTTCGKIKGLEELFAQGEADRLAAKAEREQRKVEEKQARKAQNEADYAEKLKRQAAEVVGKEQQREYARYVAGETALARVKRVVRALAFWPAVVGLLLCLGRWGIEIVGITHMDYFDEIHVYCPFEQHKDHELGAGLCKLLIETDSEELESVVKKIAEPIAEECKLNPNSSSTLCLICLQGELDVNELKTKHNLGDDAVKNMGIIRPMVVSMIADAKAQQAGVRFRKILGRFWITVVLNETLLCAICFILYWLSFCIGC